MNKAWQIGGNHGNVIEPQVRNETTLVSKRCPKVGVATMPVN